MGLIVTKKDDEVKDINDTVEMPVEGAERLSSFDLSQLHFKES